MTVPIRLGLAVYPCGYLLSYISRIELPMWNVYRVSFEVSNRREA